jgi:hypothetical protein
MRELLLHMLTLIIQILYIEKDIRGDRVASRNAEPGTVRANDVKGVVAFLSTIDASGRAVTDSMIVVTFCFVALSEVVS